MILLSWRQHALQSATLVRVTLKIDEVMNVELEKDQLCNIRQLKRAFRAETLKILIRKLILV